MDKKRAQPVLDYLSQLGLRVQQSEFGIQPRLVSRFESQCNLIPMAPQPSVAEEANERELQSDVFIPAEPNLGRFTQPADSRIHREPDILESLSEGQSTKKYQSLYPAQSTAAPTLMTPASGPETTDSPVLEVPRPVSRRQQTEQSERIFRNAAAQAQPSMKIGRLGQQSSIALPNPSGQRQRSNFPDLIARRESEGRGPIVRIENTKGEERASSPSTRVWNRRERGRSSALTDTEQ